MKFINDDKISNKTSAALGIFDGIHLGHREILKTAKNYSDDKRSFAVFTFNTSSVKSKHGRSYEYLYNESQKNMIFENLGVEYIYSPDASEIMEMSGEEFAKKILKEKMNVERVICGENFRFGKNASCGIFELEKYGEKCGFEVKCCKILEMDGQPISSGRIKEHLKNGEIVSANKLLGQNYFFYGKVVTGNRIGRTLNFPTINQTFEDCQVIPKKGVYAVSCEIAGNVYSAVTNIGVKPTVEKNIIKPIAETHILNFQGDLYDKIVKIDFIEFIREERKFSSLDQLKAQIKSDIHNASYFFEKK